MLLEQVVSLLEGAPDGLFVDATVGGAGHAAAVLDAHPGLRLLGIDRDDRAVAAARDRLGRFGARAEVVRSPFSRIEDLVRARSEQGASAVLMDLGVSSPQLDEADRGFSHRSAGPLDMRMDRRAPKSAYEVVNEYSFPKLRRVIAEFGEERHADRIARHVVDARPISDSAHLAEVVAAAVPAPARRRGGHPARRTFQAIRMEVNRELDELAEGLEAALGALAPGGRMCVLSYHSLEDRMVKGAFREAASGGCVCPDGLECVCGATPTVRLLKRGAWKPTESEVQRNPRSRSARLRAVEAVGGRAS
ncbi:MAG: 16S rRNA (cytosine(1402)-N(4))-methyltransferase RsmH [Microthrixaceae bacterium]|nr:16S rRNA (cytosine(1402)-N(4))-methyltransferase RsmH [Microthrixaceae bacterium]